MPLPIDASFLNALPGMTPAIAASLIVVPVAVTILVLGAVSLTQGLFKKVTSTAKEFGAWPALGHAFAAVGSGFAAYAAGLALLEFAIAVAGGTAPYSSGLSASALALAEAIVSPYFAQYRLSLGYLALGFVLHVVSAILAAIADLPRKRRNRHTTEAFLSQLETQFEQENKPPSRSTVKYH